MAANQLWPDDKISFSPFSYAKAIIKDETTYPIVPTLPIINIQFIEYEDEEQRLIRAAVAAETIPPKTFFIAHIDIPPEAALWHEGIYLETLLFKVSDTEVEIETPFGRDFDGVVFPIASRSNLPWK